jgi:hypothetical protein
MLRLLFVVYAGFALTMAIKLVKRIARDAAEIMRRSARALASWGAEDTTRWGAGIFIKCYMVDIELHVDSFVYRGPMYAMYRDFLHGDSMVIKLNWVAEKSAFGTPWSYGGAFTFKLGGYGDPIKLPNGDFWFGFDGGYAVLCLGKPKEKLCFFGTEETPRIYAYF